MNNLNLPEPVVIGIDHGYGNIKTARTCFQTGVTAHDQEPTFKSSLLVYGGRYYTVGDGHKEFAAVKIRDTDFYILTLAAIARELRIMGLDSARVHLAAGLPLTWVSGQKDVFQAYLLPDRGDGPRPRADFQEQPARLWRPLLYSGRRAQGIFGGQDPRHGFLHPDAGGYCP